MLSEATFYDYLSLFVAATASVAAGDSPGTCQKTKTNLKQKKRILDFNGFDFDLIALFDDGASFFLSLPRPISVSNLVLFSCVCACLNACFYIHK